VPIIVAVVEKTACYAIQDVMGGIITAQTNRYFSN